MACSNGVCTPQRGTQIMAQPTSQMSAPIQTFNVNQQNQNAPWYSRLWNWLTEKGFGKDEVIHILNTLNPEQQNITSQLGQSGLSLLQDPYQGFNNIQQGALRTFHEDIVPALLERFNASGENSASSPVIQTQLSSAGAGLAERLQGFKEQFAQQNRGNALSQLSLALNPQREFLHSPATGGIAGGLANFAGQGLGMYGTGKLYDKFIK
jgi:hypothetical protein